MLGARIQKRINSALGQTVIIWPDYCQILLSDLHLPLFVYSLDPPYQSGESSHVSMLCSKSLNSFWFSRVRTKVLTRATRLPVTLVTSSHAVLSLATLASIPFSYSARHASYSGPFPLAVLFCLEPSYCKYLHGSLSHQLQIYCANSFSKRPSLTISFKIAIFPWVPTSPSLLYFSPLHLSPSGTLCVLLFDLFIISLLPLGHKIMKEGIFFFWSVILPAVSPIPVSMFGI